MKARNVQKPLLPRSVTLDSIFDPCTFAAQRRRGGWDPKLLPRIAVPVYRFLDVHDPSLLAQAIPCLYLLATGVPQACDLQTSRSLTPHDMVARAFCGVTLSTRISISQREASRARVDLNTLHGTSHMRRCDATSSVSSLNSVH